MVTKNNIPGNSTKTSTHNIYGDSWERIFGKKKGKSKKVKNTRKQFSKANCIQHD